MPTVLMIFGLRVLIYPNDHRPVHVHVIGKGCEAVFQLNCPSGPPELRENYVFSRKELSKMADELVANLGGLCHEWRKIHGDF
jgi:hypothetical protein